MFGEIITLFCIFTAIFVLGLEIGYQYGKHGKHRAWREPKRRG